MSPSCLSGGMLTSITVPVLLLCVIAALSVGVFALKFFSSYSVILSLYLPFQAVYHIKTSKTSAAQKPVFTAMVRCRMIACLGY